jgi:hypothetical protein
MALTINRAGHTLFLGFALGLSRSWGMLFAFALLRSFLALDFPFLPSRFRAPRFFALLDFSRLRFFAFLDFSRSSIFRAPRFFALLDFSRSLIFRAPQFFALLNFSRSSIFRLP